MNDEMKLEISTALYDFGIRLPAGGTLPITDNGEDPAIDP